MIEHDMPHDMPGEGAAAIAAGICPHSLIGERWLHPASHLHSNFSACVLKIENGKGTIGERC